MSDDTDRSPRTERSAYVTADAPNRRLAALTTLPFLLLGIAVVLLSPEFAPRPVWAFLLIPPIAFMEVLPYLTYTVVYSLAGSLSTVRAYA